MIQSTIGARFSNTRLSESVSRPPCCRRPLEAKIAAELPKHATKHDVQSETSSWAGVLYYVAVSVLVVALLVAVGFCVAQAAGGLANTASELTRYHPLDLVQGFSGR